MEASRRNHRHNVLQASRVKKTKTTCNQQTHELPLPLPGRVGWSSQRQLWCHPGVLPLSGQALNRLGSAVPGYIAQQWPWDTGPFSDKAEAWGQTIVSRPSCSCYFSYLMTAKGHLLSTSIPKPNLGFITLNWVVTLQTSVGIY